jgi:hypothetical protein
MDHTATSLIIATAFTWLGMVIAISFIEAPLKFRAPGVTIPLGLGIGRLVFRALNIAEIVLAICLLSTVVFGQSTTSVTTFTIVAVALLVVQLGVIRPRLNLRTDLVLAAPNEPLPPRSTAHLAYVVSEVGKVAVLLTVGILAMTA